MKFFRQLVSLINFMQLPKAYRRLTFYSEGKSYWPHLEGLVRGMLENNDTHVCYISSDRDDPGLALKHPNYHTFFIDEGFIRNWLFENIETDLMVMTMPDLDVYQIKRSRHPVHYIYVQHSLVSLHMAYRKNAFDNYDTIFCAGPHHVKEVRAIEEKYGLPPKKVVEHGYGRLDTILKEVATCSKHAEQNKVENLHFLMAPSWGPSGVIEGGEGYKIVEKLLEDGHKVTLRPHPQTLKFAKTKINDILKDYQKNPFFNFESDVSTTASLHESDVMISDWSGAALDYAFGFGKPVLFVDVPRKINNPDYEELNIVPFEVFIREKIGAIWDINKYFDDYLCSRKKTTPDIRDKHVFNIGRSDEVGVAYINKILGE